MSQTQQNIPADLVVDYDHIHGPQVMAFPPAAMDELREERPIFYSNRYGGFWVVTRYDDIRAVLQDHETYNQHPYGLPRNPYNRVHIPSMLNPPDHTRYRRVMAPIFSPRMIAKLEPIVRDVTRQQLAKIAPLGKADFVNDLCMVPPTAMYCGMLGVDPQSFPDLNKVSEALIFGAADVLAREGEEAARKFREETSSTIDDILRPILEDRKLNPGEDLLSILLDADLEGRKLTEDEVFNIASLLFFSGTDSTASMMSYSLMFLAQNEGHRQQIITNLHDAEFIHKACQELARYNGFHQIRRFVAHDTELLGQKISKGETVLLPMQSANRDPRKFRDPLNVDFARDNAGAALTFSAGPHRCIGLHLATIQLRIMIEEIHKVIVDYRLNPDEPYEYMTSQAKTVLRHLPMVYTPA
jgi:hypothetical protein